MSGTLLFNNGTAGMEPSPKEGILAAKNVQSVLTQEAVISPTFEKMNLHIANILCPPGVSKLFIWALSMWLQKNFLFATNTNLLKSSQCVTVDVSAALHKLCHNIRVLSFFICSVKILYWVSLDGVFPFTYFTTLTAKGKKQAPNQTKSNQNQTELMQKLSLTTSSPFFLQVLLKRNYTVGWIIRLSYI